MRYLLLTACIKTSDMRVDLSARHQRALRAQAVKLTNIERAIAEDYRSDF